MRTSWFVVLSVLLAMSSVRAQGGDEEDVAVEEEVSVGDEAGSQAGSEGDVSDTEEGGEDDTITSSPDVELRYTFLQPMQSSNDVHLKANSRARLLVGFSNRGQKSFLVQGIDSSFRYSHDYNYIIQNHTVRRFDRIVPSGQDATFDYTFHVHEFFAGRPFYLTAVVYYRGEDASSQFRSAVFNSTVKVEEEEGGFDVETFFMYLAFVAIVALLGVLVWQAIRSAGRRVTTKSSGSRPPNGVELGTERKDGDVDYQWISPHVMKHVNASKQRGKKSGAGSSSGSGSDSEGTASAGSKHATRRAAGARKSDE